MIVVVRAQDTDMMAPFREDLCAWLNDLLGTTLEPVTLLRELANGEVLCKVCAGWWRLRLRPLAAGKGSCSMAWGVFLGRCFFSPRCSWR